MRRIHGVIARGLFVVALTQAVVAAPTQLTELSQLNPELGLDFRIDAIGDRAFIGSQGLRTLVDADLPAATELSIVNLAIDDRYYNCLGNLGDVAFFKAGPNSPFQLWRSDGTPGGTRLLLGFPGGGLLPGRAFEGLFYFAAEGRGEGIELWTSDGTTAGTQLFADLVPGPLSSFASSVEFFEFDGRLFFSALEPGAGYHVLWATDGTLGGTSVVADIHNPELGRTIARDFQALGSEFYFKAGEMLWRSDGTPGGTSLHAFDFGGSIETLIGTPPMAPSPRVLVASHSFEDERNHAKVFALDGTAADPTLLFDISRVGQMATTASRVVVYGVEQPESEQDRDVLWGTDGTPGGSERLTGEVGVTLSTFLLPYDGSILFTKEDAELWKTDGTTSGTTMLETYPSLEMRGATEGWAFVRIDDGIHGPDLWFTDGSVGGATLLHDDQLFSSPFLTEFAAIDSLLYFSAPTGAAGSEPWTSDGTPGGTGILADVVDGSTGSSPRDFVKVGSDVYFAADSALYVTDGTEAGTHVHTDTFPTTTGALSFSLSGLKAFGDQVVFHLLRFQEVPRIAGPSSYADLYITEDDGAGSTLLATSDVSLLPAAIESVVFDGAIYALLEAQTRGPLWRSDGTTSGTMQIADASGQELVAADGRMFFNGNEATNGFELWTSDGTSSGTTLVLDIYPGNDTFSPRNLTPLGGLVVFAANDAVHGYEPWVSDGTPGGTTMLADIWPGAGESHVDGFDRVGELVYFAADDPVHGREMWRTDGTPAGTQIFLDLEPGLLNSSPAEFTAVGGAGAFAFVATRGDIGRVVWFCEGTPWYTQPVLGTGRELTDSAPGRLTVAGDSLFFTARTAASGLELWAMPIAELQVEFAADSAIAVMR